MKTRTALKALSGKSQSHSPLAGISEQLLLKARTAEAQRMNEAHKRSALQACGPLLSVLQKRLAEAQSEKLLNNSAPAIACADLHSLLKTASAADVKDRGIARAATHAYRLWSKNPTGSLTVGDVARLRTHYQKEYPRSKVGSVIDTEVPKAGYNTLPVAQLVRIASQIQRAGGDQSAYEEACTQYGLDKNTAHAFRCRAFVRSLLEGTEPVEYSVKEAASIDERVRARMATDSDPILGRFAQFLDEEVEPEDEMADEPEMEMPESESESEVFDSPITGEPLRLELEPADEAPMDDSLMVGGDLPVGMEVMGQLEDFASSSSMVITDPTDPEGGELEVTITPLEDVNPVDEPEIVTLDGEMPVSDLEITASSHDIDAPGFADIIFLQGNEYAEMLEELGDENPDPEVIADYLKQWDQGDGGNEVSKELGAGTEDEVHEFDDYVLTLNHNLGYAGLSRKLTDEECEQAGLCDEEHEHTADCGPGAKKYSVYAVLNGKRSSKPIDTFEAKGMSAALQRIASHGVSGTIHAYPNKLATECSIALSNGNYLHVVASADSELHGSEEAFRVDVNEQMPDSMPSVDTDIMIGDKTMGEQAHPFEHIAHAVLDGKVAHRSGWELKVNGDAEVELFYKGKQKKSASLGDLDEIVAAFVEESRPAPKAQLKYAAFEHDGGGYVIVTDLPKDNQKYNAKRILSAIQKVIPATRGTLRKDARLQLEFKAGAPELGRVRRILEDQYRIAEYRVVEAQIQPTQPTQPAQPQQPAQPGVQPAQPAQPAQGAQPAQSSEPEKGDDLPVTVGPMQTQAAWSVTFETPEGEVRQAPVRSKTATGAQELFRRFNGDCTIIKIAQLEETLPGEPIGGDEDAPFAIEEQITITEEAPIMDEAMVGGGSMGAAEQEAIHAALVHYRNQGLGPMSALDQLSSQYSELLERYGDKEDLNRHEIEAEVMAMVPAIWTAPAILDKQAWTGAMHAVTITLNDKKDAARVEAMLERTGGRAYVEREGNTLVGQLSGLNDDDLTVLKRQLSKLGAKIETRRVAQYDVGVNNQQPDAVSSVEASPGTDSETNSEMPEPSKINEQVPAQSQAGTSDSTAGGLGPDTDTHDVGSFGAPKPLAQPDQQKQKGESFADTDLGRDSETNPKLTKHMDQASENAEGAYRSAKRK